MKNFTDSRMTLILRLPDLQLPENQHKFFSLKIYDKFL